MEAAKIVLNQVGVMFLLVAVGYVLIKKKIISGYAITNISNILLYLVVPVLLIKAYSREIKFDEAISLLSAFLISIFFSCIRNIDCQYINKKI